MKSAEPRRFEHRSGFRRPYWLFPICAWFVAVLITFGALGSYMHESDQASILVGGWKIARGVGPVLGGNYYNYAKQYGSYFLLALASRIFPSADPVYLGNLVSYAFFWTALAVFLVRFPAKTISQSIAIAACILAPALIEHSPFLATCFISGGFVFLGASLRKGTGIWRLMMSSICFGVAVAARADALLIVPCLLWWGSIRMPFLQFIRSRASLLGWGIVLLALCFGIFLSRGDLGEEVPTYFNAKVFLAYVIFGLGAATIVAAWIASGIAAAALSRFRRHRSFYAAGLIAFGLAPGFYSLRLFSTRYWTVWIVGMIVMLSSRRVAVLLRSRSTWCGTALAGGCALGACVPLFIGLHLPFRDSPRLVMAAGTRFPTADGNLPMGGYLFALREVSLNGGLVDHNQAIWLAARDADYKPDPTGIVRIVDSPMYSYVELSTALRGYGVVTLSRPEAGAYIDSRSLIRPAMDFTTGRQGMPSMYGLSVVPISQEIFGASILRFTKEAPKNGYWSEIQLLRDLFGGNEFHRLPMDADSSMDKFEGHTRVWYSHEAFALEARGPGGSNRVLRSLPKDAFCYVQLSGRELRFLSITVKERAGSIGVREAVSVLPDYMGIGSYASPGRQ
jgi:hypothetical protein